MTNPVNKIIIALQLAVEAQVSCTLTAGQCEVLLKEIEPLVVLLDLESSNECRAGDPV